MTRTPLRPLARILAARKLGENPDAIERENLARRHEEARDGARERAEGRLLVLGVVFLCAFMMVALKMTVLAASDPAEPRAAEAGGWACRCALATACRRRTPRRALARSGP